MEEPMKAPEIQKPCTLEALIAAEESKESRFDPSEVSQSHLMLDHAISVDQIGKGLH